MTTFSSPFDHILRTNYAPTPDELSAIRELIFEPEEKLRLLNERISQLQAERDRLQSFVDDHHALLSPARRLPRDIIAEIFLQCLPTDQLPVCDVSKAPLVLTTVCRSWREVAVATPRLWRAIHFVFPALVGYTIDDHSIQMFHFRKEGLQLWLKRAGSVPLTISCFAQFNDRKPRAVLARIRALYTDYVEVFTKYATQWRALYLSFVPLESLSPLRALNAGDLPQLSTLYLDANEYELGGRQPFEAHPLLSVMSATSLRIFHLRRELSDPFTLPVHWSSLTELNICPVTSSFLEAEVIGRLAQSCPLLRKCYISMLISDPDSHGTTNLPRQTWQYLAELSLDLGVIGASPTDATQRLQNAFDVISTPVLSTLALKLSRRDGILEQVPFLGLIQTSGCHITSLDLDIPLSDSTLIGGLQSTSSLTDLTLTDMFQPPRNFDDMSDDVHVGIDIDPPHQLFSSDFFQALSDNALCPFLKNVTLEQCTIDRLDDVVGFALARATIRSLNVGFQSMGPGPSFSFSDEQLKKWNLLKERGINAEWHFGWVGREPIVIDNSLSNSGLPLLFNGVY